MNKYILQTHLFFSGLQIVNGLRDPLSIITTKGSIFISGLVFFSQIHSKNPLKCSKFKILDFVTETLSINWMGSQIQEVLRNFQPFFQLLLIILFFFKAQANNTT